MIVIIKINQRYLINKTEPASLRCNKNTIERNYLHRIWYRMLCCEPDKQNKFFAGNKYSKRIFIYPLLKHNQKTGLLNKTGGGGIASQKCLGLKIDFFPELLCTLTKPKQMRKCFHLQHTSEASWQLCSSALSVWKDVLVGLREQLQITLFTTLKPKAASWNTHFYTVTAFLIVVCFFTHCLVWYYAIWDVAHFLNDLIIILGQL